MLPLPSQRHLFSIPAEIAYFNCAYNSPQLNESTRRLQQGVLTKQRPWERTPQNFFDDAETIRVHAATLFGSEPDCYAIVPAASYGLSTAARAIEPILRPGDRIVLMEEEFPSNVLPWRRVAQQTGAVIETVLTPPDGNWTRALLNRIDHSIRVVAVSTCHWTNGTRIDVSAIGQACRSEDSILVVDATQTLGAMPLSIAEVQPDFLVAAGYKWLLCPYGFGLLYVSKRWHDARPLEETWLARHRAEDFTNLVNYSDVYLPGARKFDMGEKCTATILPGAIAALEQLGSWGIHRVAESLLPINLRIAAHLDRLGFRLADIEQRCPHMFGAQLPAGYAENLVARLRREDIHISQRSTMLRFAPHLHVNDHDVERLLEAIDEV